MNQQVKVIVLAEKDQKTTKIKPDLSHIQRLRQRKFAVSASLNIDAIMSEMNYGLS